MTEPTDNDEGWKRLGRALQRLTGQDHALYARLMSLARAEDRQAREGLREHDQPSEADFEIRRLAMRSEFTPIERAYIRETLGLNPLAGIWPVPDPAPSPDSAVAGEADG